jgi:O-antigen/teichoic acid export membrane protein
VTAPATPAAARPAASIPAPASGWRRVFVDWLVVGGSTAACHLLGTAASLLLRMAVSPAQMGVWQALKLFLSYANYANLGISKGAAREYNVALGRGDTARARRGLDLAFTVNTATSLLYAAVLVGVGLWIGAAGRGEWAGTWALGLAAVGAMAVLSRYMTFHVTILRASQRFAVTARLALLEAALTLGVGVTATWWFGLPGLYLGTLVVLVASIVFVRRHAAVPLRPAFDAVEIRRLIGMGGPILLAGAVSSLLRSLDKWMILAWFDDREFQLGCYSLAVMVGTQLFGLGNMLATVTGPRYGEQFGRTGDRRAVALLAARASELQGAAIALPAAWALLLVPPLLAWLLPDYGPGLAPIAWLVPGMVFFTLALPASQYLVAVGEERRALAAVLAATVLGAAGNLAALHAGLGLVGVAAATSLGYAAYFVIVVGASIWGQLDGPARGRYAAMLALAVGPTLALALWWSPVGGAGGAAIGEPGGRLVALRVAAVTLVWTACALVAWRHGGWRHALSAKP